MMPEHGCHDNGPSFENYNNNAKVWGRRKRRRGRERRRGRKEADDEELCPKPSIITISQTVIILQMVPLTSHIHTDPNADGLDSHQLGTWWKKEWHKDGSLKTVVEEGMAQRRISQNSGGRRNGTKTDLSKQFS